MKKRSFLFVLFFSLISVPAFAQGYRVLPQFAVGGGWSCDIFVGNQGTSQVTGVIISFYSDSGTPLTVASSIGTASSFTINLNAGATQILRIPATASQQTGYAVVRMPSGASITVTEVLRLTDGNSVLAELGVPQQIAHCHFTFPIEVSSSRKVKTGVAFANPTLDLAGATAQTLFINLIDSNGILWGTKTLTLGVGEHYSGYPDLDPNLFPGLDEFTGLISISAMNPIGVLSLRQDSFAFGSVAVEGGPVLGPFSLTGMNPVAESEPNSSAGQADWLAGNALITGGIGSAGDVDYYGFSGRAGDVITAIVDTQGLSSLLDSVIRLEKSNGEVIWSNDQNGLFGQNDSFLQAVLPADGTYYLRVSHNGNQSGSQYTYRLHARVPTNPVYISTINPTNGAQGSTFSIAISGTSLSGASAINFNPSTGITVTNLQSSASQVTAQLTIATDAAAGSRQVTVTTPASTSNPLPFTVNSVYDGTWSGTTSQGNSITLTVSGGKLTSVKLVLGSVVFGCCTVSGTITWTSSWNITGNTFSVSTSPSPGSVSIALTGTFTSGSQVNGTLDLTQTAPLPPQPTCCAGTVKGLTWSASK